MGKHEAQIAFALSVAGREYQGALKKTPGFVVVAARSEHEPEVGLRICQIGLEFERFCEVRLCLFKLSRFQELVPQAGVRLGIVGSGGQRRGVQSRRLCGVAFACSDYSQIILNDTVVPSDGECMFE